MDAVQEKYLDIHYDHASPQQCMDIWLPNTRPSNALPVIVYFHGGAFAYGWQRGNDVIPMLCGLDRGYAVVSVQYRLSGEARFPAAVYDAKAALRYLRNHAEEYGLDSSRISLWGASAGAWLAAFTAVTIGNPAFEDLTHGPGGDFAPRVRCAVSWCGVLDMSNPGPAPATKEALDKDARSPFSVFLGAPTTTVPQLCRLASPITYVNACSTPPFMLVQDGEIHHDALAQAGFDEKWLRRQLARGGAKRTEEVFFAFLGSDGTLHIQRKPEYGENAVFVSTQGKKEDAE